MIPSPAGRPSRAAAQFQYDPQTATIIVDTETGTVFTPVEGQFTAPGRHGADARVPASVGFDNYREIFTESEFRGAFFRVLAWNIAFAALSVISTFAFGLLLAMVFNEQRMRGRKVYRSLIIIPYALRRS